MLIPMMIVAMLMAGGSEALAQNTAVITAAGAAVISSNEMYRQSLIDERVLNEFEESLKVRCGDSFSCRQDAWAEFDREAWLDDYCGDSHSCRQDAIKSGIEVGAENLPQMVIKTLLGVLMILLLIVCVVVVYMLIQSLRGKLIC